MNNTQRYWLTRIEEHGLYWNIVRHTIKHRGERGFVRLTFINKFRIEVEWVTDGFNENDFTLHTDMNGSLAGDDFIYYEVIAPDEFMKVKDKGNLDHVYTHATIRKFVLENGGSLHAANAIVQPKDTFLKIDVDDELLMLKSEFVKSKVLDTDYPLALEELYPDNADINFLYVQLWENNALLCKFKIGTVVSGEQKAKVKLAHHPDDPLPF